MSSPARLRSIEYLIASIVVMVRISRPEMSCCGRYLSTFLISSMSWARLGSSQNIDGAPVILARLTPSLTQSWIGSSLVWHIRKMSPCSTNCSIRVVPDLSTTRIVPLPGARNVLSWEPYSSAFWAINPTFETLPMVPGSNAPFFLQSSMTA